MKPRIFTPHLTAFLLTVFQLIFTTQTANATPDHDTQIRAIPLGHNTNSYFYLRLVKYIPGSNYRRMETLTLFRCDMHTQEVKDRITIRDNVHVDTTTNNNWKINESQTTSFDLGNYLRQHQVNLVFSDDIPDDWKIIDGQLVKIDDNDQPKALIEKIDLPKNPDPQGFYKDIKYALVDIGSTYLAIVLDGTNCFRGRLVVLEYSTGWDEEFHQHVVFVRD